VYSKADHMLLMFSDKRTIYLRDLLQGIFRKENKFNIKRVKKHSYLTHTFLSTELEIEFKLKYRNNVVALNLGCKAFSSVQQKDESPHREYDLICKYSSKRSSNSCHLPRAIPFFGGSSALSKINLGPERYAAVLCMELCYSDCARLKIIFQNEYELDGRYSPNCKLFFANLCKIIAIGHISFDIAFSRHQV